MIKELTAERIEQFSLFFWLETISLETKVNKSKSFRTNYFLKN